MGVNVGRKLKDAGKQWVIEDAEKKGVYWPTERMKEKAYFSDEKIYAEASKDTRGFWAKQARESIDWFDEWDADKVVELEPPYFNWFVGNKTNLSYNCIDRHLEENRNKAALIWVPEPVDEAKQVLTYMDLYREVNKCANVLNGLGVKKGSPVTIWMPMIPETAIVALACQRIGAWHSIVYTAFAPHAVRERMEDAGSKILITVDGFYRRGKQIQ